MRPDVRHLVLVVAVFVLTLALFATITGQAKDFRGAEAVDFSTLESNEVIVDMALTRRQIGLLMSGYLEKYKHRPELGVFGNHQIQLYSSAAFGKSKDSGFFFNYWFANLGLPELRGQIHFLAERGLLPEKVALVQITTPNNDNGRFIIFQGNELPWDMRFEADVAYSSGLPELMLDYFRHLRYELVSRLNYANLFYALDLDNNQI